jgi:glycosyltransferase involved in cell wall biosynthesis
MNRSFSIVTPSFNQGQFIRATIDSVLEQNVSNLQYIVMDGGSSDQTVSILKEYGHRLTFFSERDKGTADALNRGFALCRNDFIGWLNSDDVYYPKTLTRVLELFQEHPGIDVIYGRAHHIDEAGATIEEYPTSEWSFEKLINHCIISQPAAFFRRQVIERFGALDQAHKYCVDYEFWIRLAKQGARFLYVPEFFAATRLHAAAKTVASRLECHADINEIMVKHLGYVPERWISNYAHIKAEKVVNREENEVAFIRSLILQLCLADLRWNRKVSQSTIRMTYHWLIRRFRRLFAN